MNDIVLNQSPAAPGQSHSNRGKDSCTSPSLWPLPLAPKIERYRELALEMLRRAHGDETGKMRCVHLRLAMEWKELVDSAERLLFMNRTTGTVGRSRPLYA